MRAGSGLGSRSASSVAESALKRLVFRAGKKLVYPTWSHSLDCLTPFVLLRRRPFRSVLLQRGRLDPIAIG